MYKAKRKQELISTWKVLVKGFKIVHSAYENPHRNIHS